MHEERICSMILEVKDHLEQEKDIVYHNKDSKTAAWISKYDTIIHLLLFFAEKHDYISFLCVFDEFKVSIDTIRNCSYQNKQSSTE